MTRSSHLDQDWTPVLLPRASTRRVRAQTSGYGYRVSLSVPEGPVPPGGFPSMIVLDGGALFATVAETERRLSHRPEATGVSPTVIIGVGHDGDAIYDTAQRHRDFTPGPAATERDSDAYETGGATDMLEFLTEQVLPLAGRQAALHPGRRSLMGHSLAGYFTLYAMTLRPDAFSAYGAISPSIWWNPGLVSQGVARMQDRSPSLFLAAGELEEVAGDSIRARRRMIGALNDFAGSAEGSVARLQTTIFSDENHASVVGVAAARFLRFSSSF